MTHEANRNVEGGADGRDWLADAAAVTGDPLEGVPVGDCHPDWEFTAMLLRDRSST